MSVYFLNANDDDEDGFDEGTVGTVSAVTQTVTEAHQALATFWPKVNDEIKKIKVMDLKTQALPLARIKKIMKLDEDVKMISAEAPMLFAKAAEIFIHELTLRAWIHTEDNKRRTLQRNDIAMAITKFDMFDFLIDIVPRDEVKPPPTATTQIKTENNGVRTGNSQDQIQYYFQLAQQHQQALQTSNNETTNPTVSAPPAAAAVAPSQVIQVPAQSAAPQQGNLQIVHQIVTPSGEVQNIPLQLTPQQMQLIRMQLQNNTNQPVILQSSVPQQAAAPSIIQMAPQGTQVFLTQSNTDTE